MEAEQRCNTCGSALRPTMVRVDVGELDQPLLVPDGTLQCPNQHSGH